MGLVKTARLFDILTSDEFEFDTTTSHAPPSLYYWPLLVATRTVAVLLHSAAEASNVGIF